MKRIAPSCEDVLNAFAVEPEHERHTLERYLREYPQYAQELTDLSRELSRLPSQKKVELSARDREVIDAAWIKHSRRIRGSKIELLAALSVDQLREIADRLDVPEQIVTAFRERKVVLSSVPRRFLARFASVVNAGVDEFAAMLELPQEPRRIRSHNASLQSSSVPPATFEKLLIEAGVPDDKRARLMAED